MNSVTLALLVNLRNEYAHEEKYANKSEVIEELLIELNPEWTTQLKAVEKLGLLAKSPKDLIKRLPPLERVELFIQLFKKLYLNGVVDKHPVKNAYLFKLGVHKFFLEVSDQVIVIPTGDDEPRVIPLVEFFFNLPKIEKFLDYLNTYSMRNRRRRF